MRKILYWIKNKAVEIAWIFTKKTGRENMPEPGENRDTTMPTLPDNPLNPPLSNIYEYDYVIKDHLIAGAKYIKDPENGGWMSPKGIVIHFTCSYNLMDTVQWFKDEVVDIHLLVDKDGTVAQMVPFNVTADHAGKSQWKCYYSLNRSFIGIEVINIGPLEKRGDKFYDCYNRVWKGQVVEVDLLGYKYWEPFTAEQLKALVGLCKAICSRYGISTELICGHHEASPGRKDDPGGSLGMSMDQFRKEVSESLKKTN